MRTSTTFSWGLTRLKNNSYYKKKFHCFLLCLSNNTLTFNFYFTGLFDFPLILPADILQLMNLWFLQHSHSIFLLLNN